MVGEQVVLQSVLEQMQVCHDLPVKPWFLNLPFAHKLGCVDDAQGGWVRVKREGVLVSVAVK